MKKILKIVAVAAMLAVPGAASAGSNMAGFGYTMCRDFAANVDDQATRDLAISWFLGFFSGMNAVNDATDATQKDLTALGTDEKAGEILDMLAEKCQSDPDMPLVVHVHPIYETLPDYVK